MRSPESNFWMNRARPKLRESYLLDTLECGDFSFATACLLANRKYGKNTQHGDIKSHQYIISFDPRDAADNGLTMEKAQALGLKFCEENFPGHPAIVCTHPDGHNHSGNIHVHIVIGSIRTREVERKPYMQKPRDWRRGHEALQHRPDHAAFACRGHGAVRGCRTVPDRPAQRLGGRTDAAGEIKECAYDQSENRPGVPVPDSSSDR